jgi:hypothetical protein
MPASRARCQAARTAWAGSADAETFEVSGDLEGLAAVAPAAFAAADFPLVRVSRVAAGCAAGGEEEAVVHPKEAARMPASSKHVPAVTAHRLRTEYCFIACLLCN